MAPPIGASEGEAKAKLEEAREAVEELDKRGFDSTDAKGWYQQADAMFSNRLYKTAIIYAGYSLAASSEALETIKHLEGLIQSTLKRAVNMLGREHPDMSKVSELLKQARELLDSGNAMDAREYIRAADDTIKGIQTPYAAGSSSGIGVSTVKPSRGYSSCPSCGNIVEGTWEDCKYCGAKLTGEVRGASPEWTKSDSGPVLERVEQLPEMQRVEAPPPAVAEATPVEEDKLEEAEKEMEQVEEEIEKVEADLDKEGTSAVPKIPSFDDLGNSRPKEAQPAEAEPGTDIPPAEEAGDTESPKCPNCGEEIEPDWKKCPVCRNDL